MYFLHTKEQNSINTFARHESTHFWVGHFALASNSGNDFTLNLGDPSSQVPKEMKLFERLRLQHRSGWSRMFHSPDPGSAGVTRWPGLFAKTDFLEIELATSSTILFYSRYGKMNKIFVYTFAFSHLNFSLNGQFHPIRQPVSQTGKHSQTQSRIGELISIESLNFISSCISDARTTLMVFGLLLVLQLSSKIFWCKVWERRLGDTVTWELSNMPEGSRRPQ